MARTKVSARRHHTESAEKEPRKRPRKTLTERAEKKVVNLKGVKDAGVEGALPKKRRRNHPGTVAKREIRREIKSLKPVLKRAPFGRIVRKVAYEVAKDTAMDQGGIRFQADALEMLRYAAETMLVDVMKASVAVQIGAGHVKRSDGVTRVFKETLTVDAMRSVRMVLAHLAPQHVLATDEFATDFGFVIRKLTPEQKEEEADRRYSLAERYHESSDKALAEAAVKAAKAAKERAKSAAGAPKLAGAGASQPADAEVAEEEEDAAAEEEDTPRVAGTATA